MRGKDFAIILVEDFNINKSFLESIILSHEFRGIIVVQDKEEKKRIESMENLVVELRDYDREHLTVKAVEYAKDIYIPKENKSQPNYDLRDKIKTVMMKYSSKPKRSYTTSHHKNYKGI